MSTTTIRRRFKVGGVLANADAVVLSDPTGAYGVRRRDTGAVVVAAGTAMTNPSTGLYSYTFTDPASRLEYEFYVKITDGAEIHYFQDNIDGGRDGNLYDLLPAIQPYVPDCPLPVVKQALRKAAKDFFQQTGLWREDLAAIASVDGQEEYDLDHAYDADILRVRGVTYSEMAWAYEVDAVNDVLTLSPAPTQDDEDIVASVTFLPKDSCDTYPAGLLSRWGLAIEHGTKAALYAMSKKPWTDYRAAEYEVRQYRALIGDGKRETVDTRGDANVSVQGRRFV